MAHREHFPSPGELVPGEGELHARIETTQGSFRVRLYESEAPKTVANFVGLATGRIAWTDPRSGREREAPYYDGVPFHRIIEGFVLQGGDPTGTGRGGPGYTFDDEFSADLRHTRPGLLSMANAGRRRGHGTNGSQFFVTLRPSPHLDGKHTVFGEVIDGLEVVEAIGETPTDRNARPLTEVSIVRVDVERAPA